MSSGRTTAGLRHRRASDSMARDTPQIRNRSNGVYKDKGSLLSVQHWTWWGRKGWMFRSNARF
jgi:hypothetical protein